MLKTGEHVVTPFTWRSGFFTLLLVALLTAPLWWTHLKDVYGKPKMSLTGEWVGTATVTNGDSNIVSGRSAVVYFHLATLDSFLGTVYGPGQLCIKGENRIRTLSIVKLWPPNTTNNETRVSGTFTGDVLPENVKETVPGAGHDLRGSFDGGQLAIQTEPDGFTQILVFKTAMHRGTHEEYASLCRAL